MDIKKICCLTTLFFSQIIHSNNDYHLIEIINFTNLPIMVRQLDREIGLCVAFGTHTVKAQVDVELDCLVSKRKHRKQCEPIKLISSSNTTSFKFFRDGDFIYVKPEIVEIDYSSEELE